MSASASTSFRPVRFILPFLWEATPQAPFRIAASLVFLFLSKLALVMVPFYYRDLIDSLDHLPLSAYTSVPLGILATYGTVRFLSTAFSELRDAIFIPVEQRAVRHLSLAVFKHLHTLSLRFHLDRKTGNLTQVIDRGTRGIETFFRFFVLNLCPTLLEFLLITLVISFFYHIVFSLILLGTIITYVWATFKIAKWRVELMRATTEASNQNSARAVDSLLNYATTQYFGQHHIEAVRYDAFLADYEEKNRKNKMSLCLLNLAQGAILSLGAVVVMGMAASHVMRQFLTVGDFVLITTFLLQAYIPLHILGFAYRETRQSLIDMDDLCQLLQIEPEIQDKPNAPAFAYQQGRIEFQDVTFGYHPSHLVLNHISFTVEPGQTVAVVGPSGAGKSTLVSLLFRFFDPEKGRILIDGQDLRDVSQESVRSTMSVVPQDTPLFNDTLFYNIAYGNLKASPEAVYKAAQDAAADFFIQKLPAGYQTQVGERGLKLSGGEKQRVALARAILKNPKIFILDEATSSLDTQTEKVIQANLHTVFQDRTTFIIAHRLSTIVHADKILVLENGKVVEQGTHDVLMAHKGLYAKLWQKQHKKEAPDNARTTRSL